LGGSLKTDQLVNDIYIIEEKAVEIMIPLQKVQLLSYLKLTAKPKGSFHCENIKEHIESIVMVEFSEQSIS
jgi:hypothetical protein